jgi:ApaG protein
MNYQFMSTNNGFRVEIKTEFDFDQSNPLQYQYLFKYTILITNVGEVAAQLHSRKWFIKDSKGDVKTVEGPGVVGQTPFFKPGQAFEYSSFCPLQTMKGEMWGHFNMTDEKARSFKVDTPLFKLFVPNEYIDHY